MSPLRMKRLIFFTSPSSSFNEILELSDLEPSQPASEFSVLKPLPKMPGVEATPLDHRGRCSASHELKCHWLCAKDGTQVTQIEWHRAM